VNTDVRQHFSAGLRELATLAEKVADQMGPALEQALAMVRETVRGGGTLFFCGNGGSAADAQHIATEYVVRYMRERRGYPAIALTTDTSLLTAAANDMGFEAVFARQVNALARPGDLRDRGVRADALIKDIAAVAGGRGGGKPHMAQAGIPDASRFEEAFARAPELVRSALGGSA